LAPTTWSRAPGLTGVATTPLASNSRSAQVTHHRPRPAGRTSRSTGRSAATIAIAHEPPPSHGRARRQRRCPELRRDLLPGGASVSAAAASRRAARPERPGAPRWRRARSSRVCERERGGDLDEHDPAASGRVIVRGPSAPWVAGAEAVTADGSKRRACSARAGPNVAAAARDYSLARRSLVVLHF
jgi:hypothetical protein